ncbi:MAG: DEAD/DEAH box helicase [Candidatus Binatia bacterium]
MTTFAQLGLVPALLRAIQDVRYETPTPIQVQAIPEIFQGRDVLACAQTGTGKTAAFLLPVLQHLTPHEGRHPRALILAPTRELAQQIGESAIIYGKYLRVRTAVVFGGVNIRPQVERLRRGVDLVIATPGRLLDHLDRGSVALSTLSMLVLDEADRMLDMGFLPDVRRILQTIPKKRQTLLFSATLPQEIERLAHDTLVSPQQIEVGRRATPVSAIRQILYPVEVEKKRDLLCHLLAYGHMQQVLIFTRTKLRADRLSRHLAQHGQRVLTLHGGKSQRERTHALNSFRDGKVDVLVATDIAARGLDVEGISHVVNFDIPNVPEDYVHRIGRTARASASGHAISLVSFDEVGFVRDIEQLIGNPLPHRVVRGFEPGTAILRRFEQPTTSRAARIASGAIRHFSPRSRSHRHSV